MIHFPEEIKNYGASASAETIIATGSFNWTFHLRFDCVYFQKTRKVSENGQVLKKIIEKISKIHEFSCKEQVVAVQAEKIPKTGFSSGLVVFA